MKRKLANLLMRLALRLHEDAIFEQFPAPSFTILTHLECGTNLKQGFNYNPGEDGKCVAGLTKLTGVNVFQGLLDLMNDGHIKEGSKSATLRVEGDEFSVDGRVIATESR